MATDQDISAEVNFFIIEGCDERTFRKRISVAKDNRPLPGCTVSDTVWEAGVTHFALAPGTGISEECYESPRG